jgi:hypothetical protein
MNQPRQLKSYLDANLTLKEQALAKTTPASVKNMRLYRRRQAEVTKVTKHPVVEVAEGVQVGGFTVYAKMYFPAHKYSADIYRVKILEPVALQYLQHEQGSLMEHGEFQFDSVEEVSVGTKLKISILPFRLPNNS